MKRPAKQVWLIQQPLDGKMCGFVFTTRKEARAAASRLGDGHVAVGPYILAERVRQR